MRYARRRTSFCRQFLQPWRQEQQHFDDDDDECIVAEQKDYFETVPIDSTVAMEEVQSAAEETSTLTVSTSSSKPRGILRRHTPSITSAEVAMETDSRPSHWPERKQAGPFVAFLPGPSLVTSIHERPYTKYDDLPHLYYSSKEIRQFKHNFRKLIWKRKMKKFNVKSEAENQYDRSIHIENSSKGDVDLQNENSSAASSTTENGNSSLVFDKA